jgi:AraC-like DNA-binding protein
MWLAPWSPRGELFAAKGVAPLFPCVLMSSRQRFSRFACVDGLVTLRQRLVRSLPLVAGAPLPGVRMSNAALKSEELTAIPMAEGGLTRLAVERLKSARVPLGPILKHSGLTPEQIAEPEERLSVRSQIAFLHEAASALKDDHLGFTLARDHDPRGVGLLYYVMASSPTLGAALQRLARYSKVTNEALVFGYREGSSLNVTLSYSGVPRHSDIQQMEFCMFAAIRICRLLTGRQLVPQHFAIAHYRSEGTTEMSRFVGTKVKFGAERDEFALNIETRELPVIHADNYLNDLLLKYCEAALVNRRGDVSHLRTKVENAISSLLPHGRVLVGDVARTLAMSERTLGRKLADEGLNFTDVLKNLRRDLAVRYLDDRKLRVSKIAWLLGFKEVSAFTHACKRWTGKTPRQMRTTAAF